MDKLSRVALLSLVLMFSLAGCNKSPGPLEGIWQSNGLVPMMIAFRSGETEAMGIIEHVEYKVEGNTVIVTYTDGLMKGSAMKYTLRDPNTAINTMFTLKRIR